MLKKIFIFIICLIPWFFNSVLPIDYNYYNEINLPFFAPPPIFFSITWTIIYILISISLYNIFISYKYNEIPLSYKISLFINYLFNQSFVFLFFILKNPFLGFISSLGTFISTLFLYEETALIQSKQSKLIIPYIIQSLFACILSVTIYLIN